MIADLRSNKLSNMISQCLTYLTCYPLIKKEKKNQDQDQTNQDSHLLSMTVSMKISQSDHI